MITLIRNVWNGQIQEMENRLEVTMFQGKWNGGIAQIFCQGDQDFLEIDGGVIVQYFECS